MHIIIIILILTVISVSGYILYKNSKKTQKQQTNNQEETQSEEEEEETQSEKEEETQSEKEEQSEEETEEETEEKTIQELLIQQVSDNPQIDNIQELQSNTNYEELQNELEHFNQINDIFENKLFFDVNQKGYYYQINRIQKYRYINQQLQSNLIGPENPDNLTNTDEKNNCDYKWRKYMQLPAIDNYFWNTVLKNDYTKFIQIYRKSLEPYFWLNRKNENVTKEQITQIIYNEQSKEEECWKKCLIYSHNNNEIDNRQFQKWYYEFINFDWSKMKSSVWQTTILGGGWSGDQNISENLKIPSYYLKTRPIHLCDQVTKNNDMGFFNVKLILKLVPEKQYYQLFQTIILKTVTQNSSTKDQRFNGNNVVFSYDNFLKSVALFPNFCSDYKQHPNTTYNNLSLSQIEDIAKKILSTVFAHYCQETSMSDSTAEIGQMYQGLYETIEIGSETISDNVYIQGKEIYDSRITKNNKYFGRGAKQISHPINYGLFSSVLFDNQEVLVRFPNLVQNTWLSIASSIFFSCLSSSNKPCMVEIADNSYKPTSTDIQYNRISNFAITTFIINGGYESRYDKLGREYKPNKTWIQPGKQTESDGTIIDLNVIYAKYFQQMNNRAKYFEFFRLYFRIPVDDYSKKIIPFKNIPAITEWIFNDTSYSKRFLYYSINSGTPFLLTYDQNNSVYEGFEKYRKEFNGKQIDYMQSDGTITKKTINI